MEKPNGGRRRRAHMRDAELTKMYSIGGVPAERITAVTLWEGGGEIKISEGGIRFFGKAPKGETPVSRPKSCDLRAVEPGVYAELQLAAHRKRLAARKLSKTPVAV